MLFNKNRCIALALWLICAVMGWYALILMTEYKTIPKPSKQQLMGLGITFLVSVAVWVKKCFTIQK